MPGRFEKAPLVYVTALIRTSSRPEFKADEWTDFQQSMIRAGLKDIKTGINHEINFSATAASQDGSPPQPTMSKKTRYGFFSSDRHECLLLGPDYLEFRVSNYTKFHAFRDRLIDILEAAKKSVDIIGELDAQEIVLTYCDVIVPAYGRPLEKYFKVEEAILPLNFLSHNTEDSWQAGQVQATRVVTPKKKITIFLEQVPVDGNKKVGKWLPNNMIEPDSTMGMPLKIRPEWAEELEFPHFALLSTQASMLTQIPIKELSSSNALGELHELTRDTFNDIIHQSNCRQDWNYSEQ